jgi:hypothetical protein
MPRFSDTPWWLILILNCCSSLAAAEIVPVDEKRAHRYLARIEVHTAAELSGILERTDELFNDQQLDNADPIVFVLHGAEGRVFLRQSYGDNKALVDLAARLSALRVVDIRVCQTWMGGYNIDASQLQPFVDTVPFGPAEVQRLRRDENYSYF